MRRLGRAQQRDELHQVLGGDVGDRPERHPIACPANRVKAVRRRGTRRRVACALGRRQCEDVDRVLRATVDERGDSVMSVTPVQVVGPLLTLIVNGVVVLNAPLRPTTRM